MDKFILLKLHTDLKNRIISESFRKYAKPPTVQTEQTDKIADNKNAEIY